MKSKEDVLQKKIFVCNSIASANLVITNYFQELLAIATESFVVKKLCYVKGIQIINFGENISKATIDQIHHEAERAVLFCGSHIEQSMRDRYLWNSYLVELDLYKMFFSSFYKVVALEEIEQKYGVPVIVIGSPVLSEVNPFRISLSWNDNFLAFFFNKVRPDFLILRESELVFNKNQRDVSIHRKIFFYLKLGLPTLLSIFLFSIHKYIRLQICKKTNLGSKNRFFIFKDCEYIKEKFFIMSRSGQFGGFIETDWFDIDRITEKASSQESDSFKFNNPPSFYGRYSELFLEVFEILSTRISDYVRAYQVHYDELIGLCDASLPDLFKRGDSIYTSNCASMADRFCLFHWFQQGAKLVEIEHGYTYGASSYADSVRPFWGLTFASEILACSDISYKKLVKDFPDKIVSRITIPSLEQCGSRSVQIFRRFSRGGRKRLVFLSLVEKDNYFFGKGRLKDCDVHEVLVEFCKEFLDFFQGYDVDVKFYPAQAYPDSITVEDFIDVETNLGEISSYYDFRYLRDAYDAVVTPSYLSTLGWAVSGNNSCYFLKLRDCDVNFEGRVVREGEGLIESMWLVDSKSIGLS